MDIELVVKEKRPQKKEKTSAIHLSSLCSSRSEEFVYLNKKKTLGCLAIRFFVNYAIVIRLDFANNFFNILLTNIFGRSCVIPYSKVRSHFWMGSNQEFMKRL